MSRGRVKIAIALVIGLGGGLAAAPYAKRIHKYFSLKGYAAIAHFRQKKKVSGGLGNFALIDSTGLAHELYRQRDARAVVIISHLAKCPIIRGYTRAITNLKKEYETREVRFFLLNSSTRDTREEVVKSTRLLPPTVPVLLDPSQIVAKELGFTKTTEAVLIDPRTWEIVYRGAIDDFMKYKDQEIETREPRVAYLRNALEDFLHDKPVRQMEGYETIGTPIPFRIDERPLTYTQDVGPIFMNKCVYCHSPVWGQKPYFADHRGVRGWAAMIKETVMTRRMPPFGWDFHLPQPYLFTQKLVLTADEQRQIVSWIDSGAPRGEGADPLIWAAKAWRKVRKNIPPPDFEASNIEITVPPKGYNEYKFYQIAGPTDKDMWVTGTNVKSTNPATIHHQMLIVTDKPLSHYHDKVASRRDEELVEEDYTGTVPAWDLHQMRMDNAINDNFIRIQIAALGLSQPMLFGQIWDNKLAFWIPRGSYLTLETHYHGTGKTEKEITTVGLYTHKGPKAPVNINSGKVSFINNIHVPPGGKDVRVVADPIVLKKKSGLLALGLHMHMRGQYARYYANYPDGREELLASHPFFVYTTSTARGVTFSHKKILPAGTTIRVECFYDNSATNPYNPDPTVTVPWGQTVDRSEMCMGYVWSYEVPEGKDSL